MIRQAISCDICGAEKQHTNHWFVAYQQGGELRVSGWNSRNRLRADSKHLCGQTCLHKLVDEFFAKTVANRGQTSPHEDVEAVQPADEASMESPAAFEEAESSMKVVNAPIPAPTVRGPLVARAMVKQTVLPPQPPAPPPVVPMPTRLITPEPRPVTAIPVDMTPNYSSRHLRAEAWEREREREMRARERRAEQGRRR